MESKGLLSLLTAMFIFGSMGIFVRFTGQSGIVVASIAFMVSSLCLLPLLLKKNLLNNSLIRKESLYLLGIGVAGVANNVAYFIAFNKTTIASAVFFHYLAPIFAVVLAYFFLKEGFTTKKVIAVVFSLIGLVLVTEFTFSGASFIGNMWALGSAVAYGIALILYKKAMETFDNLIVIFSQMFLGSLLLAPLFFTSDFTVTITSLVFLLIIGFVHQFIAVLFHMYSIRKLPISVVAIVSYIEILFAVIFAYLFFQEIPSVLAIIGGVFIILASVLIIEKT